MSETAKRTFVYQGVNDANRIITVVIPEGAEAPNNLAIHLSSGPARELFELDTNRTDRLNVRQITTQERMQALHDGIEGLMDSLDDSVISNDNERENVYSALSDLFQNGFN